MRMIFDTETTGMVLEKEDDLHAGQPRLCEIAAALYDNQDRLRQCTAMIVKPGGWIIPANVAAIHGISQDMAMEHGHSHSTVLRVFDRMMKSATEIVAHNLKFDLRVMRIAYAHEGWVFEPPPTQHCTMMAAWPVVPTRNRANGEKKFPSLTEAYEFLTERKMGNAHQALVDVTACRAVFKALRERGAI